MSDAMEKTRAFMVILNLEISRIIICSLHRLQTGNRVLLKNWNGLLLNFTNQKKKTVNKKTIHFL